MTDNTIVAIAKKNADFGVAHLKKMPIFRFWFSRWLLHHAKGSCIVF